MKTVKLISVALQLYCKLIARVLLYYLHFINFVEFCGEMIRTSLLLFVLQNFLTAVSIKSLSWI